MDEQRLTALKETAAKAVDDLVPELIALSRRIHEHPELGYEEVQASGWLSDFLEQKGLEVERGFDGMATAFRASFSGGSGGPVVAILAEYDALPEIGHACGHNIIGVSAAGAGAALRSALPSIAGTVQVIGCPAEETGGSKAIMARDGVFGGVTAALSMHPGSQTGGGAGSLAITPLTFKFYGRPAHAAASPHEGINALDALLQMFNGINALRQHVKSDVRIHGIVRRGGVAPNIVPDYAEGEFYVRAAAREYLDVVVAKVKDCAAAGAMAAGARLEVEEGVSYDDMRPNRPLMQACLENLRLLGEESEETFGQRISASTDVGNVSHVCPTAAPSIAIAPHTVPTHSREFAVAAVSDAGHRGLVLATKMLALTAIDVLLRPSLVAAMGSEFAAARDAAAQAR